MKPGDRVRVTVAGLDVAATVELASIVEGRPLLLALDEPIKLDTAAPGGPVDALRAGLGVHGIGGMFITASLPIMRAREGTGLVEGFTGSAITIRAADGDEFTPREVAMLDAWDQENRPTPTAAQVAEHEELMHATIELSGAISDARERNAPSYEVAASEAESIARGIATQRELPQANTELLLKAAAFFAMPIPGPHDDDDAEGSS